MYSKLKALLFRLLPKRLLIKNEFLLRKIYSKLFFGRSVYCNVCENFFSRFIIVHSDEKLCPRCGSLGRHRRLWQILKGVVQINHNDRILDFSPTRFILNKLKKSFPNYLSTDYLDNELVDRRYDISNIPEPTNEFSLIICYHVLEHIENDLQALRELYRILKYGGKLIIQTPFKEGDILEDPNIISKEDRKMHFGQEDHVRIYSLSGLTTRLKSIGFNVNILEYKAEANNSCGYRISEFVLIGTK